MEGLENGVVWGLEEEIGGFKEFWKVENQI